MEERKSINEFSIVAGISQVAFVFLFSRDLNRKDFSRAWPRGCHEKLKMLILSLPLLLLALTSGASACEKIRKNPEEQDQLLRWTAFKMTLADIDSEFRLVAVTPVDAPVREEKSLPSTRIDRVPGIVSGRSPSALTQHRKPGDTETVSWWLIEGVAKYVYRRWDSSCNEVEWRLLNSKSAKKLIKHHGLRPVSFSLWLRIQ